MLSSNSLKQENKSFTIYNNKHIVILICQALNSYLFVSELVSPKAYGNRYACFKGEDVTRFLMDDDAFDTVSLISDTSSTTSHASSTSSATRRSSRLSINSNMQNEDLTPNENLIVKPITKSSPAILKTPKRKLSSSSGESSLSSKKCRTEPKRRSVSFAYADSKAKTVSKVQKQKVVPTVVLRKVQNQYISFRNQTPESVDRPVTTRRSLGETFIKNNTPKQNRSLRQRRYCYLKSDMYFVKFLNST